MKDKEINKVFKQSLKAFAKELIVTGDNFAQGIDDCKTNGELLEFLEDNADFLFAKLNGKCSDCEDKDDEIEDLEDTISDLHVEQGEMESELSKAFIPKTLNDHYKLQAFLNSKDNFSVSEMESLLE